LQQDQDYLALTSKSLSDLAAAAAGTRAAAATSGNIGCSSNRNNLLRLGGIDPAAVISKSITSAALAAVQTATSAIYA
jgi:hypothetical protein